MRIMLRVSAVYFIASSALLVLGLSELWLFDDLDPGVVWLPGMPWLAVLAVVGTGWPLFVAAELAFAVNAAIVGAVWSWWVRRRARRGAVGS
jgi:hypothetical protein